MAAFCCRNLSGVGASTSAPAGGKARCVYARAKRQKPQTKKQRKPARDRSRYVDDGDGNEWEEGTAMVSTLPVAPPATTSDPEVLPADMYKVFPQQPLVERMDRQAGSSSSGSSGAWRWDDGDGDSGDASAPMWNPRTGFMRTRAQVEAEAAAMQAADSSVAAGSGTGGTAGGGRPATTPARAGSRAAAAQAGGAAAGQAGGATAEAEPGGTAAALPAVTRDQVLGSCFSTSAGMVLLALLLRGYAERSAAAVLGTDPQLLQRLLQLGVDGESAVRNAAVAAGAAATVSAARFALVSTWPPFAEATARSNQQVLAPLSLPDAAIVALLSGASEELLFRGALIPASFPDWRGVVLSAALFGALHNSGGRNASFAAWAAGVGALYGAAYLYTGSVWVAAAAHAAANFASAAAWLSGRGARPQSAGGATQRGVR